MELTDPVAVPVLDANGNYAGDQKDSAGNTVTSPVSDDLRFTNAATWFTLRLCQTIASQVTAIQGALTSEEADLLAAIKASQTPTVDVTALAQALEASGLPAALVAALIAVLNKAAA